MNNTITDGKILTVNLHKIVFEREIEEILDMGHTVIVLLMPKDAPMQMNDIYAVKDGNVVWRIQDIREFDSFFDKPFVGIDALDENNDVFVATDFNGFSFLVDSKTGKIVGTDGWTK